jgi:hypothetical protein
MKKTLPIELDHFALQLSSSLKELSEEPALFLMTSHPEFTNKQ